MGGSGGDAPPRLRTIKDLYGTYTGMVAPGRFGAPVSAAYVLQEISRRGEERYYKNSPRLLDAGLIEDTGKTKRSLFSKRHNYRTTEKGEAVVQIMNGSLLLPARVGLTFEEALTYVRSERIEQILHTGNTRSYSEIELALQKERRKVVTEAPVGSHFVAYYVPPSHSDLDDDPAHSTIRAYLEGQRDVVSERISAERANELGSQGVDVW